MNLNDLANMIRSDLDRNTNIFVHGISLERGNCKNITHSIIENGLECHYFTIFRTVRDLKETKDLDSMALDYSFLSSGRNKALNVLIGIPDILTLDKGMLPLCPKDLTSKLKISDDGDFRSFFDYAFYDHESNKIVIPKEFIYGVYVIDYQNSDVKLYKNPRYYTNLTKQEYEEFYSLLKDRISKSLGKYLIDLNNNLEDENTLISLTKSLRVFDRGITEYTLNELLERLNKNSDKR